MNDEATSEQTLTVGAKLFCNALAAFVPECHQNLDAIQQEILGSKLGCQAGRGSRHTFSGPSCANPVAQIRHPMLGPYFVEPDTPHKSPALAIEDAKMKLALLIPLLA